MEIAPDKGVPKWKFGNESSRASHTTKHVKVAVDLRATVGRRGHGDRRPEVDGYLSRPIYGLGIGGRQSLA